MQSRPIERYHDKILMLMKRLGYNIPEEGGCKGYIMMAVQSSNLRKP